MRNLPRAVGFLPVKGFAPIHVQRAAVCEGPLDVVERMRKGQVVARDGGELNLFKIEVLFWIEGGKPLLKSVRY